MKSKLFKIVILLLAIFVSSCSKKDDSKPDPITPPGAVTITSISPDYGKAGTEIIISGTNFGATVAANTVTLGGKVATVTAATATQLKITAPADATHGTIEVKVGTATATSAMYYYEPEVTSLSTTSGKAGDVLVITGKHFGTTATDFEVKFNGKVAEITATTATTLTVKVPLDAVTGVITVARKTKAPVKGPNFTISSSGGGTGTTTGFTIIDGSVTITNLVKSSGAYGEIKCMTVDEERNVIYAGTKDQIIKIDLATNAVSTVIANSSFKTISGSLSSDLSAMDVDANGKLYVSVTFIGTEPATGSNIFVIDPVAKTAKLAGNRFVGVSIPGLYPTFALNAPFQVMGNGEIIAFDESGRELCKFSADLSVRTVIYTLPIALEAFTQLIEVNATTVRIVLTGIGEKYYYDYSTTSGLGTKTNFAEPTGFAMISQTIGGTNKYGVAGEAITSDPTFQNKKTYTIGRLNTAQTSWDKKGAFIIESFSAAGALKFYNVIGLNGKNYFYADKNGNMYAHISGSADSTGIYKLSLN
ncbi:IPT/TIG domain-containing protein [Pedobacter arcticus]|uniref:IPT/TIG domain-containing protein n=1 Tax=Pedobacter arcticus TaxID=752140 RepID=UPI000363D4AF|nr:IPT/TIG domain-containing protein [Pedobacter arcticus]